MFALYPFSFQVLTTVNISNNFLEDQIIENLIINLNTCK
jgi:hypothetical protein